ncbi:MAG: hypothetical protein H6537_01485 [Bacteroidales bacterium]|nr:hypothetical protein [Bacteroidales bacterium]HPD95193.1 hypothetical protein [Tenuifilaceae bacterium]HRX31972.1 hypothetical protein [Tenuifilaceae bacterium]
MKKFFSLATMLIIASVAMVSCSSSSDDTSNYIKFEDKSFRLYDGYQYKFSDALADTLGTPYVVTLLGEGVSVDNNAGTLTGIGSLICFYMYSENSSEVKNGEYTIDIFNSESQYTADSCYVYYNYDFAADTGMIYPIKAGLFTVENLGRIMRYNIDIVTEDLVEFKGEYEGPVTNLN